MIPIHLFKKMKSFSVNGAPEVQIFKVSDEEMNNFSTFVSELYQKDVHKVGAVVFTSNSPQQYKVNIDKVDNLVCETPKFQKLLKQKVKGAHVIIEDDGKKKHVTVKEVKNSLWETSKMLLWIAFRKLWKISFVKSVKNQFLKLL